MRNALRSVPWWALAVALVVLPPVSARGAEAAAGAGDPRRGESLYVGTARLSNGGAPCLACHGIAGHGLARAASFGPDLTGAIGSFGAEALQDALDHIPYPTMQPVYERCRITAQERADLVAFLGEASGGTPSQLGARYGAGVVGAMAAFLGAFVWIGKRGEARRARGAGTKRGTP